MCGLYAMFGPVSHHREYFAVDAWPEFPERYKIPPASLAPVVRQAPDGRRVADLLRWGLMPHWAKDETIARKLINARSETVAEKPSFRSAYRRRRCIVAASGFYEWQAVPGQHWKQPYYVSIKSGEPMAMGGIWESWTNSVGEIIRTYCIITTQANALMAPIHDRMPVILPRDTWTAWLDPATDSARIAPLLVPADTSTMTAWPVSRKISSRGDDGPDLVARLDQ
jgi:putative SOS response-associated peptidase YedK